MSDYQSKNIKNGIIDRKLKLLKKTLNELRSWQINSFYDFQSNIQLRYAVERILQICVEILIDIGMRIIAAEHQIPGINASEMLNILEELNIIPHDHPYHKMVQFRNLIVHRYEYVDAEILYGIVKKNLSDFDMFAEQISKYQLKSNN